MKKFLLLSFAMVTAAVLQAVTVSWVVPTSGDENRVYEWTSKIKNATIVYSSTRLDADQAFNVASGNSIENATTKTYKPTLDAGLTVNGKQVATVFANNLVPNLSYDSSEKEYGYNFGNGAYYYLVVTNTETFGEKGGLYAVAGTTTAVTATGQQGIYDNVTGTEPDVGEFFDHIGWIGGTWTAAQVPEPTIMALLALGVAGVALRRKQNFTK